MRSPKTAMLPALLVGAQTRKVDKVNPPTFRWPGTEGAAGYELEV